MKSILDFRKKHDEGAKISMVTCYDYTSARIVAASSVDCILVGDSLAMTMHGHTDTLVADADLMAIHTAAVRRGAPEKLIVADLTFLAHRGSLDTCMNAVAKVMRAGAQAVKIEGIEGSESTIRHIVESGVPVMGHLGLTPQSVHAFGGFKLQATSPAAQDHLLQQAKRVTEAGAFALVLECVPNAIAERVTREISIPTIGIGAGAACSGQVLVFQDLLGLNRDFKPRFVRRYIDGFDVLKRALESFDRDVKAATFPNHDESYT